jgi:tetratricopeptide (TPR) repeat protein
MASGNSRPYINQQNVRDTLDAMLYGTVPQPSNALEALLIVDVLLSQPEVPLTDNPRSFAIKHILTDAITHQYTNHRQKLGLPVLVPDAAVGIAVQAIQQESQTQNQELLSWSLLYYRYVRVDLCLSLAVISGAMNIEDRTLRRYQKHAIHRLTEYLVDSEWRIRQHRRQLRLYANLPMVKPVTMVERTSHLRELQHILKNSSPQHIQITGAAGVGKTIFVQEFIRNLIDAGLIDEVVWIDHPPSAEYVQLLLQETLGLAESHISLKEYTLENRLIVVLDNVEWQHFGSLLDHLSGSLVFWISRFYTSSWPNLKHLSLDDMSQHETIELVHQVSNSAIDTDLLDDYALQIYQKVGGNPLAIKIAAQSLEVFDSVAINAELLNNLFEHVYVTLDESAKRGWIALGLFPSGLVKIEKLLDLWPSLVDKNAISILLRHHIAEFDAASQSFSLTATSCGYIQQKCNEQSHTHELLTSLLDAFRYREGEFDIVEHILFKGWPRLDVDRYQVWAKEFITYGLKRGHYAQWLTILNRHPGVLDINLRVAQAVCLRHLVEWQQAEQILVSVLEETGQQGLFAEQGRALLELGILMRLRGEYEQAERFFDHVQRTALRFGNEDLYIAAQLEQGQLAIESRKGHLVEKMLSNTPTTVRSLALRAEGQLLAGDVLTALSLAQEAISSMNISKRLYGRLNDLLGRIYDHQTDFVNAEHFFTLAVTILEQEGDFSGLARARANLGANLIRQKRFNQAYYLLTQAEEMLLWLGDRAGLLRVRHNLNILRQGIAG